MLPLRSPTVLVVDASVAVKWVLTDEDFAREAAALLASGLRDGLRLVGPPLFMAEATNAIYQRLRRKDLTEEDADRGVAHVWSRPVTILAPPGLTERAYRFVRRHRLANVYDSHYVVLAQELSVDFWTSDQRVFNSLRSIAPWVRWIGDYQVEADDA